MLKSYRSFVIATLALVAAAPGERLHAQEANSVVGPRELRDFELPGRRVVTAPPPEQTATPQTPAPAAQEPAETAPPPAPRTTSAQPPTPVRRAQDAPIPSRVQTAPAATEAATSAPTAVTPDPQPQAAFPAAPAAEESGPPPSLAPSEPAAGWNWLYILGAALIALIGLFAFYRSRQSRQFAPEAPAPLPRAMAEPAPAAPAPAPRPEPDAELRPWLELEFTPSRAVLASDQASVEFQLVVRNSGKSEARNIRIDARMFNAGTDQDREIGAFFSAATRNGSRSNLPRLPAQAQAEFRTKVTMPRESVREYQVGGRSLFIPMVGFNAFYEWGEGRTGQTSRSYIVGTESQKLSEKMGPFRLDLGPRIYRSVGQRQNKLARVV